MSREGSWQLAVGSWQDCFDGLAVTARLTYCLFAAPSLFCRLLPSFLVPRGCCAMFLVAILAACVPIRKTPVSVPEGALVEVEETRQVEEEMDLVPLDKDLINSLKKEVREKGQRIEPINKYVIGVITQFDGFTSEMLLSFAEMMYDKADAEYRIQVMEYESGIGAAAKPGNGAPKPDFSEPIRFLSEIIVARSLDRFMDRFLYLRGFCYEEQGDNSLAAEDYKKLLSRYSQSRLVPETIFRLGEYFFNTEQNGLAIETYALLKQYKDTGFYDKALYKLGWSFYKVFRLKEAVSHFLQVADLVYGVTDTGESETTKVINQKELHLASLADEALKYAAISFAHYGSPNDLNDLLGDVIKPYSKDLYHRIGEAFLAEAKFEEAVLTNRNFIALFPLAPGSMSAQIQIISIYKDSLNDRDKEFQEREVFIQTYSFGSKWFLKNQDQKELSQILPEMIKETANYYRMVAQSKNDIATHKKIIGLYRKYLLHFVEEKGAVEINYLLADLLFAMKMYEEASVEYEKTAWDYDHTRYQEKAAYGVVLSYEKLTHVNREKGLPVKVLTEMMLQAITRYLKHFPDNPKSSLVMIKEGELYYGLGDYEKAIDYFLVAQGNPGNKKHFLMIEEYLADSFFNKKDYVSAEKRYRAILKKSHTSTSDELREKAMRYIVICTLNIANSLKESGDMLAAAIEFEKAGALSDSLKDSEFAMSEAFKIYIAARKWKLFDTLFSKYQKKFPMQEKLLRIVMSAGRNAEENFDWDAAAKYYDKATTLTIDFTERVKLLLLTAYHYDMSNNMAKSIEIYSRLYNEPLISVIRSLEYRFKVAELTGKLKDKDTDKESALEMYEKIVMLHEASIAKGGKGNSYYYGKSKFMLLEKVYLTYTQKQLEPPFEKNFSIKTRMMQGLIREYMGTAGLGIPEFTSASLYQIGTVFENFRDTIMASSPPPEFTADEKEEYGFMLEEKAFPYEEKAMDVYEKSIKLGRKLGLTNIYLDKTYERLASLAPALYKRSEHRFDTDIFVPKPDFIKEYTVNGEKK